MPGSRVTFKILEIYKNINICLKTLSQDMDVLNYDTNLKTTLQILQQQLDTLQIISFNFMSRKFI